MKKTLLPALLCIGFLAEHAQKIIEKHIAFSPKNFVSMNFQISDSIRIVTWKKDEVYIHSSIDVNDNKDNDDYKMVFDEAGSTINVTAKLETENIRRRDRDSANCCCCWAALLSRRFCCGVVEFGAVSEEHAEVSAGIAAAADRFPAGKGSVAPGDHRPAGA